MSELRAALNDAFEKHSEDTPEPTLTAKEPEVSTDKPEVTLEPKADKPRDEAGKFAKTEQRRKPPISSLICTDGRNSGVKKEKFTIK